MAELKTKPTRQARRMITIRGWSSLSCSIRVLFHSSLPMFADPGSRDATGSEPTPPDPAYAEPGGHDMNRLTRISIVTLLLAAVATPAFAGLGFHAGATVDPDDFLVGLRFKSHPIAESIYVVPNVEVGFGDITFVAGNVDGQFKLKTDSKYAPYVGAGLALVWYDFDGGSNTEFGGNILGGIMLNEKWFFEMKLGLGDVPDWHFIVGFEMP